MKRKLLMILQVIILCFALLPVTAFADEEVTEAVAMIGETTYATLDEAIEAAGVDGATITILADCEASGLTLGSYSNNNSSGNSTVFVFEGASGTYPTITFTDGIYSWQNSSLTFKDCNVSMTGVGSSSGLTWASICMASNSDMTLDNATMTMDGTGTDRGESSDAGTHAIYACGNNVLNIINGSTLTIENYYQDALEWDYSGSYYVYITDSTYISDNNRSGFTGTFYATIDNSIVMVTDSLGNGSNGTYYTIKNNSYVEFTDNRNWGISAWRIDMSDDSTLVACDNGYSGVWTRVLNVDGTCTLDVERNGNHSTGSTTNAGIFFQGNGTYTSTIETGADVTIKNNAGSGIYTNQSVCNLTISTAAVITNNGTGEVDTYNGYGAKYGGGVYNVGTMVLCDDVIIYNNHASEAGDDIYSNGAKSITFGDVNSNETWVLDDCDHKIDGWYEDGYEEYAVESDDEDADTEDAAETTTLRWSANCEDEGYTHVVLEESGTYTTTIAYKAAHGLDTKVSEPGLNKTIVQDDGTEVDQDSAAAGDTIDFELTSTVPETLQDYIEYIAAQPSVADEDGESTTTASYVLTFHDVMATELVLNEGSFVVTVGGTAIDSQYYSVTTSGLGDGCTFEVTVDLLALYTAGIISEEDFGLTSIVVSYSATLSENASAGTYTNKAWVAYPEGTSKEDQVEVDTYGITIFKYDQSTADTDEDGNFTADGLAGATFGLYTDEDCTELIVELTSGDDGYVTYEGLEAGTYYLKETEAPDGYVKSDTALVIIIPGNVDADTNLVTANFANYPIPHTGGMGTTRNMVGGALIIMLAGVMFVISRKTRLV